MSDIPYSISQVVELAGISRRTLRYYVAQGVLMPPVGHGRKAHYTVEHIERVRKVRELQEGGLTLSQIRNAFEQAERLEQDPDHSVMTDHPIEKAASVFGAGSSHGWNHLPASGELLVLVRADLPVERAEIIKQAVATMMASLEGENTNDD